jgi:hypothetical protein
MRLSIQGKHALAANRRVGRTFVVFGLCVQGPARTTSTLSLASWLLDWVPFSTRELVFRLLGHWIYLLSE